MSKHSQRWSRLQAHPGEERLFLAFNADLPQDETVRIHRHLDECWECHTKWDQWKEARADYMLYKHAVQQNVQPPPSDWAPFRLRLHRLAEELNTQQPQQPRRNFAWLQYTFTKSLHPLISVKVLAPLSAVAIVLIALLWMVRPPTVSAEQLLIRAKQSRATSLQRVSDPVIYQKLRVRVGNREVMREIWRSTLDNRVKDSWEAQDPKTQTVARATSSNEVPDPVQLFSLNQLNWQDPLSPAAFAHWREGLAGNKETVNQDQDRITLQTKALGNASGGKIVDGSLTVRRRDYHPIGARFLFASSTSPGSTQGTQEIDLAETDFQVLSLASLNPGLFLASLPEAPSTSSLNVVPVPKPLPTIQPASDLDEAEMAARIALHEVGADLGEPIDVVRSSSGVIVDGIAETPSRKARLKEVLEKVPHVEVQVKTLDELASQMNQDGASSSDLAQAKSKELLERAAERTIVRGEIGGDRAPIHDDLAKYFLESSRKTGSSGALEPEGTVAVEKKVRDLSNRALSISDAMVSEAWALRRLAKRYPPEELARLSPRAKRQLEDLVRDHVKVIADNVQSGGTLMVPVLRNIAAPNQSAISLSKDQPAGDAIDPAWPVFPTHLFGIVNQMDRLIAGLFSGAGLPLEESTSKTPDTPLRMKSKEQCLADLLSMFSYLEEQLPNLQKRVGEKFLDTQ